MALISDIGYIFITIAIITDIFVNSVELNNEKKFTDNVIDKIKASEMPFTELKYLCDKIGNSSSSPNILRNKTYSDPMDTTTRVAEEDTYSIVDRTEADEFANKVRILCWVMTCPANHKTRAAAVKATWGKRCNKLLFVSTETDDTLPTIKLPIIESRSYLWGKTKMAFQHAFKYYGKDYDWFLKADDDTYVIVENLRLMLSHYNASSLLYFGHRYKKFVEQGYMAGGPGYVICRGALEKFASDQKSKCKWCNYSQEDCEMGICLAALGVRAMDSRDFYQRERFMVMNPLAHMFPTSKKWWYTDYAYYKPHNGFDCCSDYAISFHYVRPDVMFLVDYFIYRLRPYGIDFNRHTNLTFGIKTR